MAGARVLHWNGKDIPEELRELSAGTYVVQAVDQAPSLSPDEEQGLVEALASQVRTTISSLLRR